MSEKSTPLNAEEINVLFPRAETLPQRKYQLPLSLPVVEYDPVVAHDPINVGLRPAYTLSDITRRTVTEVGRTPGPEIEEIGRALVVRLAQENIALAAHTHTPLPGIQPEAQGVGPMPA